jgi:integrase
MRTYFRWLEARDIIGGDPTAELRLKRAPDKHPRFLEPSDVVAICRAIIENEQRSKVAPGTSSWLLPIVRANVYLGLRAGEVVNLRWADVDLDAKRLTVANTADFTTKAGKERTIPIASPALEVLRTIERRAEWVFPNHGGTQLHRLYLSRRFKHFARRAKLPEAINFHATRHTAASWLAQQGASVEAIRRFMGHSSISVTQRYMHLSPDGFAGQIERAFAMVT